MIHKQWPRDITSISKTCRYFTELMFPNSALSSINLCRHGKKFEYDDTTNQNNAPPQTF